MAWRHPEEEEESGRWGGLLTGGAISRDRRGRTPHEGAPLLASRRETSGSAGGGVAAQDRGDGAGPQQQRRWREGVRA